MTQKKWITILLLTAMLCCAVPAFAVVEAPADIYVGDYANVLSETTEQYIIEQNQALEAASGAQIVIVTVDFLDGMDIEEYAYTIFNDWGIGDAEKNNGLLLLLAIGEENYWAVQGKGLEGILSSGMLGDYLYEYLEPDFAAGNYDAGVYNVFQALLGWFYDYYDLSSSGNGMYNTGISSSGGQYNDRYIDNTDVYYSINFDWLFWLLLIIVIISWYRRNKDRKRRRNRNYPYNAPRNDQRSYPYNDHHNDHRHTGGGMFGGGSTRGGGAGRRTGGSIGGGSRSFGGSRHTGGGFGGGSTRGGGAGRRR